MLTTLVEPKFRVREISEEVQAKLTLSLSECENQTFKEIRCGYCDFPVGIVSISSNGYLLITTGQEDINAQTHLSFQ